MSSAKLVSRNTAAHCCLHQPAFYFCPTRPGVFLPRAMAKTAIDTPPPAAPSGESWGNWPVVVSRVKVQPRHWEVAAPGQGEVQNIVLPPGQEPWNFSWHQEHPEPKGYLRPSTGQAKLCPAGTLCCPGRETAGEKETDLESLTWDYPGKTQSLNSKAGFKLDEITVISWTICKQK